MLAREQSPFALIQTDDVEGILCLVADAFCALAVVAGGAVLIGLATLF